jgi:DNA-binding PadR family transcriptional regulator
MATNSKNASNLSPEYLMLGYLMKEPSHGYEIFQHIRNDLSQIWHLSMSQIYNILARLEKKGYITSEEEVQENQRVRKMLFLSETGRRHFEEWLFTACPGSARALRIEFLTRHYFMMRLFPDKVPQMIAEQIGRMEIDLAKIQSMLAKIDPSDFYNHSAVQMKIDQLNTMLYWFKQLQENPAKLPTSQSMEKNND